MCQTPLLVGRVVRVLSVSKLGVSVFTRPGRWEARTHSSSAGIMEELSAALNSALERALTGDSATPLTPNDVASKSREEIEAAVLEALGASAVLDAIRNPDLVHSLLLEMAATGKRERVISALQQGANPNSR
jgi:hypothetical protein